jgi:parallel beta-helix repeat protein
MEALRKTTLPLVATAAMGLGLIAGGGQAQATVTCSKVAAVTGSDSAAGTEAAPFRSAQKLADSLTTGQVGCLRSGTFDTQNQVKVTRPGTTLTSFPGERATVKGRLWVDAHDVTVVDLNIDGRNQTGLPSPSVTGSGNTFRGLDVTNHHTGICFSLGHPDWARAIDTVIEDSRIHDCGHLPATNFDHGIYVSAADGTIIRDNWIYDNADRGIQLYSDADDSRITRNVIDGNGSGIIFGGSPSWTSDGNVVKHNLITNSRIRDNVESSYGPQDLRGQDNVVRENCIDGGAYDDGDGGIGPQVGFTAVDNLLVDPRYVDRGGKDFNLRPASPCASLMSDEPPVDDPPVDEPPVDDPPVGDPPVRITLEASDRRVPKGNQFTLAGVAPEATEVAIRRRTHGHWRTIRRRPVASDGFDATVAGRPDGRQKYRAVASGLVTSKRVVVKVRG